MLNSALTVEANKIGSHMQIWRPFISELLANICKDNTGIIFVLFGSMAKTFTPYIRKDFHLCIEVEHPAYFARTGTKMPYDVFSTINELVYDIYKEKIQWYEEY